MENTNWEIGINADTLDDLLAGQTAPMTLWFLAGYLKGLSDGGDLQAGDQRMTIEPDGDGSWRLEGDAAVEPLAPALHGDQAAAGWSLEPLASGSAGSGAESGSEELFCDSSAPELSSATTSDSVSASSAAVSSPGSAGLLGWSVRTGTN
jgi:hypothetical protein